MPRKERPSPAAEPAPPPPAAADEEVYEIPAQDEEAAELVKQAAIREVVAHAERVTRAAQLARPMESYRGRPIVLGVLAAITLTVAIHAYVARPAWVFGPDPAVVASEPGSAHLRYAMYLVAQRLLAHRQVAGTLPSALPQVGESWPAISYRTVNDSVFELRGQLPGSGPVLLRSTDDLSAFLGTAARHLREVSP